MKRVPVLLSPKCDKGDIGINNWLICIDSQLHHVSTILSLQTMYKFLETVNFYVATGSHSICEWNKMSDSVCAWSVLSIFRVCVRVWYATQVHGYKSIHLYSFWTWASYIFHLKLLAFTAPHTKMKICTKQNAFQILWRRSSISFVLKFIVLVKMI